VEKDHGRIEKRICRIFSSRLFINKLDTDWQETIACIIQVERYRIIKNNKSCEISYYVSTGYLDAREAQKKIREHWGIENQLHYVRDVSLKEDRSRIRKQANVMARLRSFALNLMRANKKDNISEELYGNSLDIWQLLKYNFLY